MAGADIQAGIKIKALVEGLENIDRLQQELQAAGVDTTDFAERAQELRQELEDVASEQALIEQYQDLGDELQNAGQEMADTGQRAAALDKSLQGDGGKKQQQDMAALEGSLEAAGQEMAGAGQRMGELDKALQADGSKQQQQDLAALEGSLEAAGQEMATAGQHAAALDKSLQGDSGKKQQQDMAALEGSLETAGQEMAATGRHMDALDKELQGDGGQKQQKDMAALGKEQQAVGKQSQELAGRLKDVDAGMDGAAASAKDLAAAEKKLAADSQAAAAKLDALNDEAQELKALADARLVLGIDTDDKARAEIEKVNKAFNDLKASGTLTQEELARASDLHRKKINELEKSLQEVKPTLAEVANGLQGVATKSAGLALVAREAMKFEDAMAGVKKVVDGTPEQMGALTDKIKELAGQLGIVPAQLAEISAQGGQLGIPIEKIGQFTEMAAKMSVAFGMTAEEAGNAAATIANVFQLPIERVEELGDAINVLGNNTAARERDISAAMARIGGNAKQFGLAAEEAAALTAAFIALGKSPEVASTAINALLSKLQTAEAQGKTFQEGLEAIGVSANQLAADIQANPQQALTGFLQKLEQLDKQSRAIVLTQMFGTEYSDDVALLVGSLGEYEKALGLVADKGKVVGAMHAEVEAALNTTDAKINQAKASFSAAAATIGEALLPAISATAEGAASVADAVGYVAKEFPVLTQLVTLYAAARVAMQAFETVAKLTGITAPASFLKTQISIQGVTAALTGARGQAAALNAELAKTNAANAAKATVTVGQLGGKLATAANAAGALAAAFSVGWAVGDVAYKNLEWVRTVGDELGRALAYADALFTDRTFEDVRTLYETSAEQKKRLENQERELKKATEERAAAEKVAAEEAAAHINGLQETYRGLKAQYDAVARSMALLSSEGLAGGEAYAELGRQADELKDKMAAVGEEIKKASAEFKFDTGAIAEAKTALEGLGLTAEQVQSGISESAAEALGHFDKAALQFGNDAEQMGRIFEAALAKMDSPEAIEALRGRLNTLGKQAGFTAAEIDKIGEKAPAAAAKAAAAFAKIGVDADAAATGISSKANQAFADWAAASAAARDAGIDDTRLIRAGFEQMMGKLESRAEFEAFKRQLQESGDVAKLTTEQLERLNKSAKDGATAAKTAYEQMGEALKEASSKADFARIAAEAQAAFEAGTISAAEYDQMMAQVKQATDEAAAKAAEMGSKAVDAHKKATIEASNYEASVKRAAAATADATKANQSASGAASEGTRTITQLHQANTKLYGVTKLTKEEFIAYSKAMRGAVHDGMDWFQAQSILASRKEEFIKPIVEGRQAIEELNQAISSGTLSAMQITRAALIAGEAVGKLDQATLKTLNASIDAAKAKLVELKDEAVGVRQSLEAELAALNGNDEMGYQLEHQKKIADLQAKAAQASANHQSEAAAEYNRAISLQNQIYAKQKEQREKERAEAAADAKKAAQAPAPSSSSNSNSGNPLPDVDLSRLNFGGDVGKFNDTLAQMLAERDQKVVNAAGKAVIDQLTDAVARQK